MFETLFIEYPRIREQNLRGDIWYYADDVCEHLHLDLESVMEWLRMMEEPLRRARGSYNSDYSSRYLLPMYEVKDNSEVWFLSEAAVEMLIDMSSSPQCPIYVLPSHPHRESYPWLRNRPHGGMARAIVNAIKELSESGADSGSLRVDQNVTVSFNKAFYAYNVTVKKFVGGEHRKNTMRFSMDFPFYYDDSTLIRYVREELSHLFDESYEHKWPHHYS